MTIRPDRPPSARPSVIGLPFHGLVTDGVLTLPNSTTRSYTHPSDGSAVLVEHQQAATLTRTATEQAADTAAGYQWLPYALLSGGKHQIGGHELGHDYHLYCDGTNTWLIRIEQTGGATTCSVAVYLTKLFGVVSDKDYSFSERTLAELEWTPKDYNNNTLGNISGMPDVIGNVSVRTYSKTGDEVLLNVGADLSLGYDFAPLYLWHYRPYTSVDYVYVHDLVTVTISGTGSLVAGSIGSGITASIAQELPPLWNATDTEVTVDDPGVEYSGSITNTKQYLYVLTPDGDQTNVVSTTTEAFSVIYTAPDGAAADVEVTYTDQITFGGNTFSAGRSYSGTYLNTRTPSNQGAFTVNGVGSSWSDGGTIPSWPFYDEFRAGSGMMLPLVVIARAENAQAKALFATGGSEDVADDDNEREWAFNPKTEELAVDDDPVAFV
jgi:hypothetical protein